VTKLGERVTVLAFATFVVVAIIALAFAVGYIVGKMLL
jgi:hypothetical protein